MIPPPIGSPQWASELSLIGTSISRVDEIWLRATKDLDLNGATAHDLDFRLTNFPDFDCDDEEGAAIALVCYLRFHQDHPAYAAFLNLRTGILLNYEFDHPFWQWFNRQLVAMYLYGNDKVVESLLYYLWVDPFEVPKEANKLMAFLQRLIPLEKWGKLLTATGPVPWEDKREVYDAAAEEPSLHEFLKEAMIRSFLDVYGKVDAVHCAKLVKRLPRGKSKVDETLSKLVFGPQTIWVEAVGTPSKAGASLHDGDYMIVGRDLDVPRLVVNSEIWFHDRYYGKVVHFYPGVPTNDTFAWKGTDKSPPNGVRKISTVYVIKGSLDGGRKLAGKTVELWPPGLRDYSS